MKSLQPAVNVIKSDPYKTALYIMELNQEIEKLKKELSERK
jgi:hypothetical protein